MLWHIAWRNVWRNRLRSLVIISSIALGLLGGAFSYAFMSGLTNQAIRTAIRTELGNVQVYHPDYPADRDLRFAIDDVASLLAEIRQLPRVTGAAARVATTAMLSSAEGTAAVRISGIDLEQDAAVSDLRERLVEGEYLGADQRIPIVISRDTADDLEVHLRSRVVASVVSPSGEIVYGAFRVVGIFQTADSMFDQGHVFVVARDLRSLTAFASASASEVVVRVEPRSATREVASGIADARPDLLVRTWEELSPRLQLSADFMSIFGYVFVAIILLALGFGIVNTMLMVVMERTREIGMLMALGMARARVFRMLLYETTFLSLVGGLVGLAASVVVVGTTHRLGVNLQSVASGLNALGYDAVIYPESSVGFYFKVAGMVLVTAFLASVYPALRALRLLPAVAIRADT